MYNYGRHCLIEQEKTGKNRKLRKAQWFNQKPEIAVFIALSASVEMTL